MRSHFIFWLGLLIPCLMSAATNDTVALSYDMPAVDGVNGKIDYLGGWMDGDVGNNISGSLSAPVGKRFGVQGDFLFSNVSSDGGATDFFNGGAHFFWRDPDQALLGVFAAGQSGDSQYSLQAGVEGEYYFPSVTINATAGAGYVKYDDSFSFLDSEQTRFVGSVSANWYVVDNLMIQAGYANLFEQHLGTAVLEYQTPLRGLSDTAEGGIGSNDYDYLLFGLRYYFGREKTLKQRHREDDPSGLLRRVMNGIGLVGAENMRTLSEVLGARSSGALSREAQEALIEAQRAANRNNGTPTTPHPPLPPTNLTTPEDLGRIIVPPSAIPGSR